MQRSCACISKRPPKKQTGNACIGRSRGGLTTKLHARVIRNGLSVQLELSPGQAHDAPMADLLLSDLPKGAVVIGDRAYDSDWIREIIEDQVALGFSAAIGTLLPPAVSGELVMFVQTNSGLVTLGGVAICMLGIAVVGRAGHMREQQTSDRGQAVPEFNLRKGIAIAIFSGVISSCFNYGLASGDPIRKLSLEAGADPLMQSLPVLVVVLLGGFTTNCIWSVILM